MSGGGDEGEAIGGEEKYVKGQEGRSEGWERLACALCPSLFIPWFP